jgi:cytochrome P450
MIIPGPRGGLLLGSARAFTRDAPGFLLGLARAYGPIASFRLAATRAVLIAEPALVEEVLVAQADAFVKPRLLRFGRLFFGDALTALDGEAWRARRRVIAPVFQRPTLDGAVAIAAARARDAAATWADGGVRRFDHDAMALALAVVTETLVGAQVAAPPALGAAVALALRGIAVRAQRGWAWPDWIPTPSARWMRRGMREVRAFVARATAHAGGLAARLHAAPIDPRAARDELAVSLCLGAHQVALALAWAVHLVASDPEIEAALAGEVERVLGGRPATAAELARLPYARAVVNEALRLYPPFYALVREPVRDVAIGGVTLRAGALVVLSPYVAHRDPRWFDAPDQARPARWLGDLERRLPRFAYFPFGGGPRVCPANRMVPAQVVAMLASLVQTGVVRAVPGAAVTPTASIALGFRDPLAVRVDRRAPRALEAAS